MFGTIILVILIGGLLYYKHRTKKSRQAQTACCEHHAEERLEAFIPLPDRADTPDDVITLVDVDGEEQDFRVVDVISVNGQEYALLLVAGTETDDGEGDVLVLRMEEDSLAAITDDDEFAAVVEYLSSYESEENA